LLSKPVHPQIEALTQGASWRILTAMLQSVEVGGIEPPSKQASNNRQATIIYFKELPSLPVTSANNA